MDDGLVREAKLNYRLVNNHKCIYLSGRPDWITLSPKPHKPPRQYLLSCCHELKWWQLKLFRLTGSYNRSRRARKARL